MSLLSCHCTNVYCLFFSFYKGLTPLWMRQIPYTMMKFACFERTIEFLYKHVVPVPRYGYHYLLKEIVICLFVIQGPIAQVPATSSDICCWLHSWCILCYSLSSSRLSCIKIEFRCWKYCCPGCQIIGLAR